MFFHIFKYQLKLRLRDKIATFWACAFPIVLALLFNIAFSNLLNDEEFKKVDVALVSEFKSSTDFQVALKESDLFNIRITDKAEAETLLSKNKISGYIIEGNELSLTVNQLGINQSILKEFVDTYQQLTSSIGKIIATNPEALQSELLKNDALKKNYTSEKPLGNSTNITVIYFYSLIAMVSLLGANLGSDDIINIQGNQSPRAARINIAPTNKLKIFMPSLCATMTYHFSIVFIYILFIDKVLKVDFGASLGLVILLAFAACFTGVSMGTMISSLTNKKQAFKTALIIGITMTGSFLSGMMAIEIKYLVQKYVPILSYINPANLITDGLYSLYYFDTFHRYFLNLGLLTAFGFIFIFITYLVLRRQQYASI